MTWVTNKIAEKVSSKLIHLHATYNQRVCIEKRIVQYSFVNTDVQLTISFYLKLAQLSFNYLQSLLLFHSSNMATSWGHRIQSKRTLHSTSLLTRYVDGCSSQDPGNCLYCNMTILYFNLRFSCMHIQKGKPVELVDIPGDERVRDRLFSKYKNSLRYVYIMWIREK